ncbi:MAG: HEAT repeat domain-containing protein [Limnohabitans sp.]|nr:HEAT repeat domain-containing protein [Limnohabitans sp.]
MRASLASFVLTIPVSVMGFASAGMTSGPVPPSQHGDGSAGTSNPAASSTPATTSTPQVDNAACKIKPVAGLTKSTIALFPLLDDPVAFAIDERGDFYFAESDRQDLGVEDNRHSSYWLLDDIACETVNDRLKMYEKWASKREGGMAYYSKYADRVTKLTDADRDGIPETRTLFAGPFNDPLDGTGAGLLALDGNIFYTNIPHLWRLIDTDGNGVAEIVAKDSSGYGVRVALRGHDMHGLVLGYDGKVYWSIGDRGYDIRTSDGVVLHDPRSGAVFRMNPDGSELELYCTGLRNPQELAFDNYGNLFTGDNNSDGGDKARFVYCMEGGETGWSMDYQTLEGANQRGPWNQEGIWHLRPDLAPHRFEEMKVKEANPLQPAWTLPPLDHVGAGPSGLVFYPGLGLPERYNDHFFLCDFLGGDSYSRILSFAVEPVGAGFKVVDEHPFVENVLPTDVDFGYDGKMYITDWGGGWGSGDKGELYAVWDPTRITDPRLAEVKKIFAEGFAQRDSDELASLLAHPDRRVRQRAQFALASRGRETTSLLGDVVRSASDRFARIHAMWALGQQAAARLRESSPIEMQSLARDLQPWELVLPVLADRDPELRAQAARMLGEARAIAAADALAELCSDDNARVRAFAAMALGRMGAREKAPFVVSMIVENADRDPFLRHAGVQALAWMNDRARLGELAADPAASIRMAACLAMRKLRDPRLSGFLNDPERTIRLEAARAINDIPMLTLRPQLAASAMRFATPPSATVAEAPRMNHDFTREVWKLGRVGTVEDLRAGEIFTRTPDESKTLAVAEAPKNAGNQYIARIRGSIEAPETGEYEFAIASDDDSILFLGASDDPTSLVEIAHVEGYANPGDYEGQPSQRSKPIRLEKGKRYAIQALHAEGGGGDHCSIMWRLPSGRVEAPIGALPVDRSEFPHLRRAIEACLAEGTIETASLLCDLALSPANPLPMRLEALEALGAWKDGAPRNRVNGAYRVLAIAARDESAFKATLARKLASLAENPDPTLRSLSRDIAAKYGVSLDPEAALRAVSDTRLSPSERVSSLRSLAGDKSGRLQGAVDAALASDAAELRAEARTMLRESNDSRALAALSDAAEHGTTIERQRAIRDLAFFGSAADAALAPLTQQLVDGSLDPALRLEVAEVATGRSEGPVAAALERWKASFATDPTARYEALALEGGDIARGRNVVLYHMSAVCMKCHAIAGSGGNAAPPLDGVASRGDARYLLHSLINPNERIVDGYANAGASAMPAMGPVLTDSELRDVVAYLKTLK